jgi:hypothetical protein
MKDAVTEKRRRGVSANCLLVLLLLSLFIAYSMLYVLSTRNIAQKIL